MQLSHKDKSHNNVDYYPLPTGYADVFLHKNEVIETDGDGNTVYVTDEVYFNVPQTTTKEMIEQGLETYWANEGIANCNLPSTDDRVDELENIILILLRGEI